MIDRARRHASWCLTAGRRFLVCEEGVTAIEYGLIACCIAVAFLSIVILVGGDVGKMFTDISSAVDQLAGGGS